MLGNRAAQRLLAAVSPALLTPPINMLRISLHPDGLAPGIVNIGEIRSHLLHRLKRQVMSSGDAVLADLLRELSSYPGDPASAGDPFESLGGVVVPLRYRTPLGSCPCSAPSRVRHALRCPLSYSRESFFPLMRERRDPAPDGGEFEFVTRRPRQPIVDFLPSLFAPITTEPDFVPTRPIRRVRSLTPRTG